MVFLKKGCNHSELLQSFKDVLDNIGYPGFASKILKTKKLILRCKASSDVTATEIKDGLFKTEKVSKILTEISSTVKKDEEFDLVISTIPSYIDSFKQITLKKEGRKFFSCILKEEK